MRVKMLEALQNTNGPILVTGNTGFKGAWLTQILDYLDINYVGVALPPENKSLFEVAGLSTKKSIFLDLRNFDQLLEILEQHRPVAVIHLAAQPLVLEAYKNTIETFSNNVMSTVTLLEAIRNTPSVRAVAVVTTDKVYENKNKRKKYVEKDRLKGIDPYSASKVAVESVIDAYRNIFYKTNGPRLMSLRAGNVIGGGDIGENRLIPDAVRAHLSGIPMEVRNPSSTRPWLHVIDPLMGYLLALQHLLVEREPEQAINFGPQGEKNMSVKEVLTCLQLNLQFEFKEKVLPAESYEAQYLDLNSALSAKTLGWKPAFNSQDAIRLTAEWWKSYFAGENASTLCQQQIKYAFDFY